MNQSIAPKPIVALDLYAGSGWGVACQQLGIEEHGVEIMDEAVQTRYTNGMKTAYRDVWEGLENPSVVPEHSLQIASPPCQTFSMAGSGKGREALDTVIGLIESKLYRDTSELRAFGESHDPRTALVLVPLAYAYRFRPTTIVWEQVPTVLPVWEAAAVELRALGYSVATGNVHSEQYGVPQTRKRAILIARRDGQEARLPAPTHSKYYNRDRTKLDDNVLPWVSMAEALGWGMTERPSMTVTGGGASTGGAEPFGNGARKGIAKERDEGRWEGKDLSEMPAEVWPHYRPSPTIVGSFSPDRVAAPRHRAAHEHRQDGEYVKITIEEAALLQSYPEGFRFAGNKGKQFLQCGNAVPPVLAKAVLEAATANFDE